MVTGKVTYATALCSDDNYSMGREWTGPYRGGCLVKEVTATIAFGTGKTVVAFPFGTPFASPDSTYSQFAVDGDNDGANIM